MTDTPRKVSKMTFCDRHAPWFARETRRRQAECMVEGGPGTTCSGGTCTLHAGTDFYIGSVCFGQYPLTWTGEPEAQAALERQAHRYVRPRGNFHDVLMVAFALDGDTPQAVHEWLMAQLPAGDHTHQTATGEVHLDSWWVANDERFDGSDCDSAVFVSMGKQKEARALLREHGLMS